MSLGSGLAGASGRVGATFGDESRRRHVTFSALASAVGGGMGCPTRAPRSKAAPAQVEQEPGDRLRVLELADPRRRGSATGMRTSSISSSVLAGCSPSATPSATKRCIGSRQKPGVVQKLGPRSHVPPGRAGLLLQLAAGARLRLLASSSVPAGSSRSFRRAGSRSWRTSTTGRRTSTATIATAPGCSTISRSCSPQRSTVTSNSFPS